MKAETKTKIKDWFIITRIRILNFIKEHKYVSAVVGMFLLTAFIVLIVRAVTDETISSTSVSVVGENRGITIVTESDNGDNTVAPNFSNVIYKLEYSLGEGESICNSEEENVSYKVDKVVIEASIPLDTNIRWIGSDETAISNISTRKQTNELGEQQDFSVLEVTIPLVNVCSSNSQILMLQVLNAKKDTKIEPEIKIKGGSNGNFILVNEQKSFSTIKTSYDEKKTLIPLVKSGVARKTPDGNRDVMFGIVLGIDSNLNLDEISLKNKYLDTSADITLIATQGSLNDSIEIHTENTEKYTSLHDGNYYGINNNSRHFFTSGNMPDLTSTSGKIESLTLIPSNEAKEGIIEDTQTAPVVTLTGNNDIEIEKYPVSTGATYKSETGSIPQVEISSSNYTKSLYDSNGNKIDDMNFSLTEEGNYEFRYEINGTNDSKTIMISKIKVVDTSNEYTLRGAKKIYVQKGTNSISNIDKLGIYKNDGTIPEYSFIYHEKDSSEVINNLITVDEGTYIQDYIVDNVIVASRTIEIVENLPSITSEKISIKTANTYAGEKLNDHYFIDDEGNEIKCTDTCTVSSSSENSYRYIIDKKDELGYITEINKLVNIIPKQYKLSISSIMPNFTAMRLEENFYAIGAYYVTAKSIRNNVSDAFDVNLKAILGDNSSVNTVENKEFASGEDTSSVTNKMYVTENSKLVEVTNSNKTNLKGDYFTAAMGEEVLLTSNFEYGYDSDANIKELTAKILVNGNLIPIAYTSNISGQTSSYFGYEIRYNGQKINDIPEYEIKYYDANDNSIEPENFDSESQVISYIIIKIRPDQDKTFEIKPGTSIKIMTKYKVKTFAGNSEVADNLNDLKFNGNSTFSWNVTDTSHNETYTLGANEDTPYVYITPYKVRTIIGIGSNDNYNMSNSLTLDASKNEVYTIYATTDVTSPAMNINSNIFGYNRINSIPVVFELPEGVNYVYNKNYTLEPSISYSGGKTILTYTYTSVEPNSWIEPIYFDFNVDVSSITGNFNIKVSTGDVNNNNFTIANDVSSIDKYKETYKNINIVNVEKISYGQYIYDESNKYISNIDKDDSFVFVTKLHNNTSEMVNYLNIYTILPYISTEKDSLFSGTYEIENLPESTLCTTDDASMVTKADLVDKVNWQPCSDFKKPNGRYSGFSAFKITYDTIEPNDSLENKIKIYTIGNKPDDVYTFKSYLQYQNSDYKSFKDINLEVISKKITGVVWEDFNVDGIMDDSEKKISNVTLNLYNSSNEIIQTTSPDENGKYTFSGVLTGDYYIVADFNTDKYGITGNPSEDFYDKTRLSVFKSVPKEVNNTQTTLNNEEIQEEMSVVKTDTITIGNETRIVRNINLGLSLRKSFEVKVDKYITKAEITNALGVVTTKDYGNTKLAKLDVKDINNLRIKVIYTLEIENVKYYPGYVTVITEAVPDGMNFNSNYEENKGWVQNDNGTLTNSTLANEIIREGEKKYLTIAFDITRKEAGSFVNFASVDELQILGGISDDE